MRGRERGDLSRLGRSFPSSGRIGKDPPTSGNVSRERTGGREKTGEDGRGRERGREDGKSSPDASPDFPQSGKIARVGENETRSGDLTRQGMGYPNWETVSRKLGVIFPAGKGNGFLAERWKREDGSPFVLCTAMLRPQEDGVW